MQKQVFYPWRRYLARMFDIFIYEILWLSFLAFAFHVNLSNRNVFQSLLNSFAAIAIMLAAEPLWLKLFSTTPGKAIFGLRITSIDGRRLSYGEGITRTWRVISSGMGYNIPFYNLFRLWKSYKMCIENETLPWDDQLSYTIKDKKWYRCFLFIGANAILLVVLLTLIHAQHLPPNRGDLTIAEFAENHNYYAEYFDIDFGNKYLDKHGKWAEKEFDGTYYIGIGYDVIPEYNFTIENGKITGVSFSVEIRNNKELVHSFKSQMITAALAFAGAQKEISLYSGIPGKIVKQIDNNDFKDFQFNEAGITFTCDVEHSGYVVPAQFDFLVPEENADETYFSLRFSMIKEDGSL
ncbi:MAG TPA: RDD family protein [Clostridiales bacterium]|nr:RDD family protein [Clostridiales bacterium]